MKLPFSFTRITLVGLLALSLAGCAAAGDRRSGSTLIGAGFGAAAGAVISDGDPMYAIGGAAIGGLLGNILTEDRRYRRSSGWNRGRHHRSAPPRHVQRHHHHHRKHRR